MIYFVQPVAGGHIKIGTTKNLAVRLFDLSVELGCELTVLGVMEGSYPLEKRLHRMFAPLRVERELFRPEADLLAFIKSEAVPWGGKMVVPSRDNWVSAPLALGVRGSAEWKAWVEKVSKFDRLAVAVLVERALSKYAKEIGFTEPPPER